MSASDALRAVLADVEALEVEHRSTHTLLGGRPAPTHEDHEKLCSLNGAWVICADGRIIYRSSWDTWEAIAMFALNHPDAKWWAIAPGVGVFDPRPSEKGRALKKESK